MPQIIPRAVPPVAGITVISDVLSHSAVTVADKAACGVIRQADDKLRLRFQYPSKLLTQIAWLHQKRRTAERY